MQCDEGRRDAAKSSHKSPALQELTLRLEVEIEDPRLEQLLEDDHGARKWPYDAIRKYVPNIFQTHFSMDVSYGSCLGC